MLLVDLVVVVEPAGPEVEAALVEEAAGPDVEPGCFDVEIGAVVA